MFGSQSLLTARSGRMSLRNISVLIISVVVFIGKCQGQPTFMCDNFCSNNVVVTCTCEDAGNPSNMTVWKLVNSSTSCSITLNQTGACNATSDTCATIPGIMAVNDPPMMTGAPCDSSTLHITKGNRSLEGLQIDCMSPDGTSYGGIRFSSIAPSIPAVTICRVSSHSGLLVVNPATGGGAGGIPTSYNVTISTGTWTVRETLRALHNGTATYSFTYSGTGVPSVIATAINCAGSAISTMYTCSAALIVEVNGLMLLAALVSATIFGLYM